MAKDYYETLGVSKSAGQDEIKRAYKELAKKYHPDLHKGDKDKEEKFKEINEAYTTLSDDKSRANYDRFGSSEYNQGFQAGDSGFDFRGFDFSDINDLFGDFFGGGFEGGARRGGRASRARKGQDLLHSIEITLEDAAKGVKKEFILEKSEQCVSCGGTGADGGELSSCPDCGGTGYVRSTRRTAFGIFSSTAACRRCGGAGSTAKKPCKACNGNGYVQKRKNIEVDIPAGIESGANLRVSGEGEAGSRGGRAGDLYITVHVAAHDFFTRRGNDIFCKVSIPFATAALGGEAEVPTIEGTASIKIPSGTQSGASFRLRGKGMPVVGRYGSGDEYVEVVIKVPSTLSRQEREALERYRDLSFEK